MALETLTNKVIALGNGVTTVFTYSFIIPTAETVVATFTDSAGTQTVLVPAQYTITGLDDPNGGTITYPLVGSPMATGETLTLERIVPYTQPTVLTNQGNFYPDVVEGADDWIVMQTQQLAEQAGRTITFPAVDPAANSIGELPAWQARASMFLGFDAAGLPIAAAGSIGTVPVSAFMETVLDDTTAAAARTTLGAVGLTGAETIAGAKVFSSTVTGTAGGTGTTASFSAVHATSPGLGLSVTGQAADAKNWDIIGSGLTLLFRTINDALSGVVNWLTVTRAAGSTTVDSALLSVAGQSNFFDVNGLTLTGAASRLSVGATYAGRSGTNSTNSIQIYNGTAPVGTMANGVTFYSAVGELWAMDAGGTATQLTSHDPVDKDWVHHSRKSNGREVTVHMEKMAKMLDEQHGAEFKKRYGIPFIDEVMCELEAQSVERMEETGILDENGKPFLKSVTDTVHVWKRPE